jgi:hypothetical protein
MFQSVTTAIFMGVIATAILDCWSLMLRRMFQAPVTNWGHVGRWAAAIPTGRIRNDSINDVPPVDHEKAIGWTVHYLIGVVYAAVYLAILSALSRPPDLYSALIFGVCTVLAPWLILQPGLGAGYFASRTPKPNLTRSLNLLAHIVFGFGLYVGWRFL